MQYDLHLRDIEKEAEKRGEKIGRAEGEKIGMANAMLETAKRMIKKGIYSLEEIAENVNMSLSEIQAISASMA